MLHCLVLFLFYWCLEFTQGEPKAVPNFSRKGVLIPPKKAGTQFRLYTATRDNVVCFKCEEPGQPADWRHSDCAMHACTQPLFRFPTVSFATPPPLRHSLVSMSDDYLKLHLLVFFILNHLIYKNIFFYLLLYEAMSGMRLWHKICV